MGYTTVIFDMDGTILDTLQDLWISVSYALGLHGMEPCPLDRCRRNLGNGMDYLMAHCAPEGTPAGELAQVTADFKAHYAHQCEVNTRPYHGINELLDTIAARGMHAAVVSNKGDFAVQELVGLHFPSRFAYAVGEREGVRRKPAPDVVNAVMTQLRVTPAECVYVGDSEVDVATAANAGIDCISVTWGFRKRTDLVTAGATHIVTTIDELLAAIIG